MKGGLQWAFLFFILASGGASAQAQDGAPRLTASAFPGVWESRLSWNIGHSRGTKTSELDCSGITVAGGSVGVVYRAFHLANKAWLISGEASAGRILTGTIRDSDFGGGAERSRSRSEATGISETSVAFAMGLLFPIQRSVVERATVWVGFSWQRMTIRMQNGQQVFPTAVPSDLLDGLDSRYRAAWRGPWVAVDPSMELGGFQVTARLAIHIANEYRGEGRWNLRQEYAQPRSFSQTGDGFGLDTRLSFRRNLTNAWSLNVRGGHSILGAEAGRDRVFLADGRTLRMVLRKVESEFTYIQVGLVRELW